MLLFLGGLLLVVQLNWSTFTSHWRENQEIEIAWGARNFFYSLANGHLLLILFIMPFLLAPAIVEEREKKTLDLLVSSPISIFHLVFAKLISPLLYIFLLMTGALPVLALCYLGGGLGLADIAYTYLLFLATAVLYSCLGLFCSTLRPRVYEVHLLAVGMTFMFCLAIPFHGSIWNYISLVNWKEGEAINHGFQLFSPFYILRRIIFVSSRIDRGALLFVFVTLALVVSGVLLLITIVMVRRIASGAAIPIPEPEEDDEEDLLKSRRRDYEISFNRTTLNGNPGLILERRVQWFARLPVLLRLFYSALMISVLTLPLASYQGSWLFLSLPFVSAAFLTLPLAATSISSDYERETINLLRTSLLSTRQIVYAKFATCLQYSFLIALALYLPGMLVQVSCSLLGYEVDLVTGFTDMFAIVFYPVTLFFSLVLYTAWGIFCSAFFLHSNRALVASGVAILLTLSAPFLIPQIGFFALSAVSYFVTFLLMFFSPLAGITTLFPAGSIKYLDRSLFTLHGQDEISYYFSIAQCLFFCALTYFLLNRAEQVLENQDR